MVAIVRLHGGLGRNVVIQLTRLNNQQITVNSDLIKLVESNPDTVITLVNGDKILVHESVNDVVARVIEFRRAIISGPYLAGNDPGVVNATIGLHREQNSSPHTEGRSRG